MGYHRSPKSIQKTLSRPQHSKLKKIQGLFKDLHRNLRIVQGKMEFKDFSRTSPKIQGLFKGLCKPCNHGLRFTGKMTFGRLDRLPQGLRLAKSSLASVSVRKQLTPLPELTVIDSPWPSWPGNFLYLFYALSISGNFRVVFQNIGMR